MVGEISLGLGLAGKNSSGDARQAEDGHGYGEKRIGTAER
jgi:hypothetical protein